MGTGASRPPNAVPISRDESISMWAIPPMYGKSYSLALSPAEYPEYRSVAIAGETGNGIATTWDGEIVHVTINK